MDEITRKYYQKEAFNLLKRAMDAIAPEFKPLAMRLHNDLKKLIQQPHDIEAYWRYNEAQTECSTAAESAAVKDADWVNCYYMEAARGAAILARKASSSWDSQVAGFQFQNRVDDAKRKIEVAAQIQAGGKWEHA